MCSDFNAHSSLWGSTHTDANSTIAEDMMETRAFVCLNGGCGTRVDVVRGVASCLDLITASNSIASLCECNVMNYSTVGSDHFQIWFYHELRCYYSRYGTIQMGLS